MSSALTWLRETIKKVPTRTEPISGQQQRYVALDEVLGWIDVAEGRFVTQLAALAKQEPVGYQELFNAIAAATDNPYPGAVGVSVKAFTEKIGPLFTAPVQPVNARLVEALRYWRDECSGAEPSLSVFARMVDEALAAAEAQQAEPVNERVIDRTWARFCGAFGDGPDAPYPGMIEAFETHYGQSFRDKDWRTEAACWAAAWHKAVLVANPQAEPVRLTDKECAMATTNYAHIRSDHMLGTARAIEVASLRANGLTAKTTDCADAQHARQQDAEALVVLMLCNSQRQSQRGGVCVYQMRSTDPGCTGCADRGEDQAAEAGG